MSDDTITSRSALNDALQSLLCRASDNDIDVAGGWDCRNGPEYPDWDIVITEVEKKAEVEKNDD